jgi:hypothetical protein
MMVCGGLAVLGLCASPAWAQKQSVAEEILGVLRAEGKISDQKYQELMSRAKAESEQREAGVEAFRRDPIKEVKGAIDWLNRFSFSGDMRNRFEGFFQDGVNARTRERIRFRFGATLKISDEVLAGFRLVSGDPNDPISANQTLGDAFTKKPINIDQAYITLTPKQTLGLGDWAWNPITITAGKFPNPLFRPRAIMTSEMLWDDDLMPEGTSETLTFYQSPEGLLRSFALNAIQWTAREAANQADSWVLGGQFVGIGQLLPYLRLTGAVAGYHFAHKSLLAQAINTNSSLKLTNSAVLVDGTIVEGGFPITPSSASGKKIASYLDNFNIFNGSFQLDYDTGYPKWPATFMVDYAVNTSASSGKNFAVWSGLSLGATKNPGDWAVSGVWARTETNSVVSYFSFSDFGRDGGTNLQGPYLRVDYMLFPRLVLTARNGFVSFIDRPPGQSNALVSRLQLDASLAF